MALRVAKFALPILAILGIALWIVSLKADIRHLGKEIDGHKAWEAVIQHEVDHGVGKPVPPEHVSEQVRAAFERAKTLDAALARQNAALHAAEQAATARNSAATAANLPTEQQKAREPVRRALSAPDRSTGVQANEWGSL